MFRLKRNRRTGFVAVIVLSSLAALVCSCARRGPIAEGGAEFAETTGNKNQKPAANDEETDRALEEAARQALGDLEGSVLVMDPQTGRLRAVVNPRLAFEQAFPPGSTIKSFTSLAAMRGGLIDRESRTLCPGRFNDESLDVFCSHPRSKAPFNLAQALAYSCNYFFARLSGRLSFDALKGTLASAGFGARTGVNAGAESAGSLRDADWRVRDLLGEGDNLLVTPIQLLSAYCALVNGGHLYRPKISESDKLIPEERTNLHIAEPHRAALVEGMRDAVVYGTAEKARLASLPMFIFGKTGTSTSSNGFRRQGWFVSFAADARAAAEVTPESLELAVLVFIKRSHGLDAAVVSHRVFEEYAKRKAETWRGKEGETPRGEDQETRRGGEGAPNVRVKLLNQGRVVKLSLEDYVLGVLSVEAAVEDEIEALKAQAVVIRTYALRNLGRHANEGFDLCSNTHCQQYVSDGSRVSELMRRAVIETAGEVLRDSKGQVAEAYFHAACGGHTANFEALWGTPGPGYLRGVRDEFCTTMPNRDWTDEIPGSRLAKALASDPLTDVGEKLDAVVITKRDVTGRAEIISIEGERRRQVRGWDFKLIVGRALGWNVLKSSRFNVSQRGSVFVFRGSGFGHGLGLCQNGAHVMARRGARYQKILTQYFPGASFSKAVNAKTPSRQAAKEMEVNAKTPSRQAANKMSINTKTPSRQAAKEMEVNAKTPSRKGAKNGGFNQPFALASLRFCIFPPTPDLTLSSEHFHISYPPAIPRAEIEAALRVLEAARLNMVVRLRPASIMLPESKIYLVIHETTQDFVAATSQSWWVAGVTHGARIELQPLEVLRRRQVVRSTLRHEYAHAVIEAVGGSGVPRWLTEGLAISFADEAQSLERFAPTKKLSLYELERRLASPGSAAEMRSLYAAAYREVRSLINKDGETNVWRRLVTSKGTVLPEV